MHADSPRTVRRFKSPIPDQVAALRFAVGLPQPVCEEALARCHGDTVSAERLLRASQSPLAHPDDVETAGS